MAGEHVWKLGSWTSRPAVSRASMPGTAEPEAVQRGGHVRVLAIGAHPDDVELGCGATLAAHRARQDEVALLVLTTGEQGPQAAASRVEEQQQAADKLGATLYWGSFDDG